MTESPTPTVELPDEGPAAAKPANPFDQFDTDEDAGEPGLYERARLNSMDAHYRGTLAGSGKLLSLSQVAYGPDEDQPAQFVPEDTKQRRRHSLPPAPTPAHRREAARKEYESIVADLARYDSMRGFGTTLEAASSFYGVISGSIPSPETFVAWPVKGVSMLARAAKAGVQQAAVQLATDPAVQTMTIAAGGQAHYEPLRTAAAPFVGFVVGGGLHMGGELIGPLFIRRTMADLGKDDPSIRRAGDVLDSPDAAPPIADSPTGPQIYAIMRAVRDGNDLSAADARLLKASPDQLGALGKIVAGKSDDELRVLAVDVADLWERRVIMGADAPDVAAPPRADAVAPESDGHAVVRDAVTTLKPSESRWIDVPEGKIYLRRSEHPGIGESIDIPTIEFDEAARGKGSFTGYLSLIEREAGALGLDAVYVEQVMNPRLVEFLRRRGYREETPLTGADPGTSTAIAGKLAGIKSDTPSMYKKVSGDLMFIADAPIRLSNGATAATIGPESIAADALAGGNRYSRAAAEIREVIGIKRRAGETDKIDELEQALKVLKRWEKDKITIAGRWMTEEERLAPAPDVAMVAPRRPTMKPHELPDDATLEGYTKRLVEIVYEEATGGPKTFRNKAAAVEAVQAIRDGRVKVDIGPSERRPATDVSGRIKQAYLKITGGRMDEAVKLSALRAELSDISRATVDAELGRLLKGDDKTLALMRHDDPRQLNQADRDAAFNPLGEPFHVLWMSREPPAAAGGDAAMVAPTKPPGEPEQIASLLSGDEQALMRQRGVGQLPAEQARVSGGTPTPPPTAPTGTAVASVPQPPSPAQTVAIQSLQQQAKALADAIGIPLRQGRIKSTQLGIFKSSGVIRVREVPDFEVVAHEAGHAIEAKIGTALTNLTNTFRSELAPLVSNPAAYAPALHVKEGFAEFVRRYIDNPAHAQNVAPGFTQAFRDFLGRNHPDILKTIDDAGAAYRAYIQAPSVDAVGAVRRSRDEEPKGMRRVMAQIKKDGFAPTIGKVMEHSYTALMDRDAPVALAVRDMVTAIKSDTGQLVDLKAADNPEVLQRLFARTEQAAVRDMMDGVRPYRGTVPQGPSLSEALSDATGAPTRFGRWNEEKRGEFSNYLIARRAVVLWDKHAAGDLPNPPTSFSRGDAVVAMAELERANPSFAAASDKVHAYTRELLRKSHEGGLIDTDLYNKLVQEQFYVPFMRDMSDRPQVGGKGGAADRVADVVQRMKGSSRDIKDPIESLMLQTFLVNRTVRHNDIIRSFVGLARKAGIEGGKYVEALPAHEAKKYTFDLGASIERVAREKGMTPDDAKVLAHSVTDVFGEDPLVGSFFKMEPAGKRGEPIIFYKEGGELRAARFMAGEEGHALYETLTALPTALSDVAVQLLSTSSAVLRSGITTNPAYALTNYIRDQVAVGILRPDYIPFVSGWRGLKAEVTQGEAAKLYGYAGGVSAGASIAPLKQAAEANVDALAKQGYIVNRISSLHGLLELASVTEAGTRNSIFDIVFKQKKKQGLSDYEAMIDAADQARDIMDFSRWGSKTMALRAVTPFVNAHLQGLNKAYRTMIQPLIREAATVADAEARRNAMLALTKVFALGGTLGAAWAAIHAADEIYRDASPQLKGTHFVTTVGGKVVVIPKPFELSLGFTAGEYAFQRLMKDDPRAAEQFIEAAYDVLKPPTPFFDNPAIKTSVELATGKSFFPSFFNPREIVPDQLKRLEPAQQYTDRTSSVAKSIGKAIGVSPIKVEYGIGSLFGLWGRDMMALSSGIDERAPAQSWEDATLVRRFIKDPTRSSDATTKFWGFMGLTTGKYNQAVNSYDALVKGFRETEAREFLMGLPSGERAFVIAKSAAREDGRAAFGADEKRLHPLQHAYDAVTLLNGVRRELSDNAFKTFENGENVKLSPTLRRDLNSHVRELAQMEMRNALVIMKEPGYSGRQLFDVKDVLAKIKALSPAVADEIATRYATSRIYTTQSVAAAYPRMRDALLRYGSEADLGEFAFDAKAEGYQFDGDRVKQPPKRRLPIPASMTAPP